MVGGETLYITLTTGILGHVSQVNTERISLCKYIYMFRTIKVSSGEIRTSSVCLSVQLKMYKAVLKV